MLTTKSLKWFFAMACVFCAPAMFAQSLSVEDLRDLKTAGLSVPEIVTQIQKKGISFDPSPSTLMTLKKSGVEQPIISALLIAKTATTLTERAPAGQDNAELRALYAAQNFDQMITRIQRKLAVDGSRYKLRAVLTLLALKTNNRELAIQQIGALRADKSQEAHRVLPGLEQDLARFDEQEARKKAFSQAIAEHHPEKAMSLISELPGSDSQKLELKMYIEAFRGNYEQARANGEKVRALVPAESAQVSTFLHSLYDAERQRKEILEDIDNHYIHSPITPSYCGASEISTGKEPLFSRVSFEAYAKNVQRLLDLAPLDDSALDLAFHVTVLGGDYDKLQVLGDSILAAKGSIKIPFYSNDQYFNLIIDAQGRRIYTEKDAHPFKVAYVRHQGFSGYAFKEGNENPWNGTLQPFDLSFDRVTSLTQEAKDFQEGEGLASKSYALKFGSEGAAPSFALMHYLYCSAGTVAGKKATHNLGQFVLHVVNRADISATLQDLKAPGTFWKNYRKVASLGATATGFGTSSPMAALEMQELGTIVAQDDQVEAIQSSFAIRGLEDVSFPFDIPQVTEDLDQIVVKLID